MYAPTPPRCARIAVRAVTTFACLKAARKAKGGPAQAHVFEGALSLMLPLHPPGRIHVSEHVAGDGEGR